MLTINTLPCVIQPSSHISQLFRMLKSHRNLIRTAIEIDKDIHDMDGRTECKENYVRTKSKNGQLAFRAEE